jgi:zinc protease
MSSDELAFTKSSIGQSEARKYETGGQKASYLSRILSYNLAPTFSTTQNELLQSLNVYELKEMAKNKIPDTNKMNILLVGDKAKVWDGLKAMGYEMVELDKDGEVIAQ